MSAASWLPQRRAGPADAPALARLHHQVWLDTYGSLAPASAIAALGLDHRLSTWAKLLATEDPVTLMAHDGDHLAGLVTFGAATSPIFGALAEVRHLYVDAGFRSQGHGLRLLTAALIALRDAGHPGAGLAVVEDNHRARAFYLSAGGAETARFTDKGPLWRSQNRLISWQFS